MSILSSNHPVENQVANSISRFLSDFQDIRLFRACGCVKTKGISVEFLFAWPDPRRLDSLNERKLFKS